MTRRLALIHLSPQWRKKARNEKVSFIGFTPYPIRDPTYGSEAPRPSRQDGTGTPGLPEEEVSLILCPLTPPPRRGVRGTFRPKTGGTRRWGFRSEKRRLISEPRPIIEERSKKLSFLNSGDNGSSLSFIPPILPSSDQRRWRQLPSNILPSENSVPRC